MASISTLPLKLFASKVHQKASYKIQKDFLVFTLLITTSKGPLHSISQYQLFPPYWNSLTNFYNTLLVPLYSFIILNGFQFPGETLQIVIYFLEHINYSNFLLMVILKSIRMPTCRPFVGPFLLPDFSLSPFASYAC